MVSWWNILAKMFALTLLTYGSYCSILNLRERDIIHFFVVVDAEELLDQSLCTWVTKSSMCPSFQPGPASSATNVGASSRSPSKTVAPRTAGTSARQR